MFLRRDTSEAQCSLPEPLKHGKFRAHPRRCPVNNDSSACLLVPRSLVPNHWVLYYSCNPGFHLTAGARASLCTEGRWVPTLPACIPDCKLLTEIFVINSLFLISTEDSSVINRMNGTKLGF